MSHVTIDPVKTTITRLWSDLSPKLVAQFGAGIGAATVQTYLAYIGIHISLPLALAISLLVGVIAGYLKADKALLAHLPQATVIGGATTAAEVLGTTAEPPTELTPDQESAVLPVAQDGTDEIHPTAD